MWKMRKEWSKKRQSSIEENKKERKNEKFIREINKIVKNIMFSAST